MREASFQELSFEVLIVMIRACMRKEHTDLVRWVQIIKDLRFLFINLGG